MVLLNFITSSEFSFTSTAFSDFEIAVPIMPIKIKKSNIMVTSKPTMVASKYLKKPFMVIGFIC